MSRRKTQAPSLADALAKGFAELNAVDEEQSPSNEVVDTQEVQEKVIDEHLPLPDYSGPTQHVAQKTSFVVRGKETDPPIQEESEQSEPKKVEILDRPSTSIGDDFDVEW